QGDTDKMAQLYSTVFPSYPFPIDDPKFLSDEMSNGTRYFAITDKERIVALSAADVNLEKGEVEMTDFATLPEYRQMGLASYLLAEMERTFINDNNNE